MNSPGLQQRTRCSRSLRIGSLLLVHPLSSDETRVSPLQKGDNVPKILLLTKYPYGLSFLLWPCRDVHTFPIRDVTELACEHSCPLHLNPSPSSLSRHWISAQVLPCNWTLWLSAQDLPNKLARQATRHSSYPHKNTEASNWISQHPTK